MWISEEEASIRLGSNRNLLNRVQRDSDYEETTLEPEVPKLPELGDEETRAHVKKAIKQSGPRLSKKEAADAVIIGQLAGRQLAADLYQKNEDHIRLMGSFKSQTHDSRKDKTLVELIEDQRSKIRDAAFKRLGTVMECLDENKIRRVEKARDLGVIGLQLSTIAEKMLPKDMQAEQSVHFHMFRPEVKSESAYESVTVGEERQIEAAQIVDGEVEKY